MEALTPPITNEESKPEILFSFTFQLRKKVAGLVEIMDCLNNLQEQETRYDMFFGLEDARFFCVKIYEKSSDYPTLQFDQEIKSVSDEVKIAITKLNFAIAHDANIIFESNEDKKHFSATVLAPKNQHKKKIIVENLKLISH